VGLYTGWVVSNRGGEIFLPFHSPNHVPALTHVRSTLVVSAIQAMRARGLYDAYEANLPPETRPRILELIAGQWIPAEMAVAHYRAVDQLSLAPATIEAIGADVADRTGKTVLHTAVKVSKALGATPWAALSLAHRLRETSWRGSDLAVYKLGPKEARYDWVGQPCAEIPYFTRSFTGFVRALIGLFCRTAYASPLPALSSPTSLSIRIAWV
jgi:hypothetical protein